MRPAAIACLLSLTATAAACSDGHLHTLGPAQLYLATPSEPGPDPATARLEVLPRLDLPENATLRLTPLWFAGHLHGEGAPHLQVVVRAHRVDGGTMTWRLGPQPEPRAAEPRPDGRYRIPILGPETGPLPARDLFALDILVASLPEPSDPFLLGGAAAVATAPEPASIAPEPLRAAEIACRDAGGRLELALRVPIHRLPKASPADRMHWLVAVEAEPNPAGGSDAGDLERLGATRRLFPPRGDGDPAVVDAAGRPITAMSALALGLRVTVPDHTLRTRPPDGPPPRRPEQRRDDRFWEVPPERELTQGPRTGASALGLAK